MKNIIFAAIFSAVLSFGSSVQAITVKENTSKVLFKGGDKKKKKKSCDAQKEGCSEAKSEVKKEECTKAKKSCCAAKKEEGK